MGCLLSNDAEGENQALFGHGLELFFNNISSK